LTAVGCPKVFSFTLSWSLPFSLSIIFDSTRRHPKTTPFRHTNPFKVEKGFKVELTLKVVKSPVPTLITNDYLPLYI
jgi:hypothetical protein